MLCPVFALFSSRVVLGALYGWDTKSCPTRQFKGTDRYSDILIQRCISDSHYLVSTYIDAESIRCGACGVALGVYMRFVSNISIPNRFRIDASMMHRYQKNRYTLENSDPYPYPAIAPPRCRVGHLFCPVRRS